MEKDNIDDEEKSSKINEEELAEAFAPDKKEDDEEKDSPKKKKQSKKETILLFIFLILVIGAAVLVKILVIDNKNNQIEQLNAEKDFQKTVIDELGIDLDTYKQDLLKTSDELEGAASDLKRANSTLSFLLGTSASQLVSKYLLSVDDISIYNFFNKGIENDDYKLYVAARNSRFQYENNEHIYTARISYLTLNKTYRELFGQDAPKKNVTTAWCSTINSLTYDPSIFEGTGGFSLTYDYADNIINQQCKWPTRTYVYDVGDYYATSEGFEVEVFATFGNPIKKSDYDYAYNMELLNGKTVEWGGPSCRTDGKEFVRENKDNLPLFVFKFKNDKDNEENYYLNSISRKR